MKPAKWIERFLHFTHRERNGLIVFVLLVIAFDLFSRYRNQKPVPVPASFFTKVEQINASLDHQAMIDSSKAVEVEAVRVTFFDPNAHNLDELIQRGVPENIARNFISYRDAGGVFRNASDVQKIYGMNDSIWNRLKPYVIYPEAPKEKTVKSSLRFKPFDPNLVEVDSLVDWGLDEDVAQRWDRFRDAGKQFRTPEDLREIYGMTEKLLDQITPYAIWPTELEEVEESYPVEEEAKTIEINTVDSIGLIAITGIGTYTASKILETRRSLGGFYSLEQLRDIFGLREENIELFIPYLRVDTSYIVGLNINQLDVKELASHPYISFDLAEEIIGFRQKFRDFQKVEELKKLYMMDDELYQKLAPYIVLK